MALCSFNVLSLFAGIGGMDKAVRLAVPKARTVVMVEGEAAAAAILVQGMQNGSLDEAPLWDRLETFDGKPWRGVILGNSVVPLAASLAFLVLLHRATEGA